MMFFSDWSSLLRIVVLGVATYTSLVAMLRISGARTLSKLNSFDLVVTVALGSTFASALLQRTVSLADALLALALLIGMQWITTWLTIRSPWFARLVKTEPVVLFANGGFVQDALWRTHVTEAEVEACMRAQGLGSRELVQFVVLETNGELTAVRRDLSGGGAAVGAASTLPAR